jgi:hypothetical protein
MKKTYMAPVVSVWGICVKNCLMTGSNVGLYRDTETSSSDRQLSRDMDSFWDDEE